VYSVINAQAASRDNVIELSFPPGSDLDFLVLRGHQVVIEDETVIVAAQNEKIEI